MSEKIEIDDIESEDTLSMPKESKKKKYLFGYIPILNTDEPIKTVKYRVRITLIIITLTTLIINIGILIWLTDIIFKVRLMGVLSVQISIVIHLITIFIIIICWLIESLFLLFPKLMDRIFSFVYYYET